MGTHTSLNIRWRTLTLACFAAALITTMNGTSWGQEPLFGAETSYYVGDGPCGVAVGDFDEDGHVDIAVSLQYMSANNVAVLLGNGNGTFVYSGSYTAGGQPRAFATEDFNDDGHLDLAVTNPGTNNISILLGNGDGTFQSALNSGVGIMPLEGIAAADFDGNGDTDLAVTNYWSSTVSALLGLGDGTFQAPAHYAVGWFPRCVAAADFDEDGTIDLVASGTVGFGLWLLTGNGDGTFEGPVSSSLPGGPWIIATADFDHDGHMDLAVTKYNLSVVSVMLGHGDGTFGVATDYGVGSGPRYVTAADFDGDGNVDLAVTSQYEDTVSLMLGNGDGTFHYALDDPVAVGSEPFGLAPADFDEDGYPDLAVAEHMDDSVTILLSNREVASVTVTYDGDLLASTGGNPTVDVNLVATLRDDEGDVLDIDDELVTFSLEADGVGAIGVSAFSDGGVAHAVEPLEPGIYAVEVTLASHDATASAELVVYNPHGGFVTGGGWMVPEDDGWNTCPDARFNFGFNVKYINGQPRGHIRFRSSDGYIDLRSTSIELLVVSGGKVAHFMGWASVNGEKGYWFLATAVDNSKPGRGVDAFTIDIWAPGVAPEDEPTETVGGTLRGGNVTVHEKPRPVPHATSRKKGWQTASAFLR